MLWTELTSFHTGVADAYRNVRWNFADPVAKTEGVRCRACELWVNVLVIFMCLSICAFLRVTFTSASASVV